MEVLNKKQIQQKIDRLAIEIIEGNYNASKIYLGGINNNGLAMAKKLLKAMSSYSDKEIILFNIKLNPASPLSAEIDISLEAKKLKNQNVVIVDDVANTGRTIFFAFKPFLEVLPKKIEVAVLVDRKHKNFPVKVDYVGLSLATTLKETIDVKLKPSSQASVALI